MHLPKADAHHSSLALAPQCPESVCPTLVVAVADHQGLVVSAMSNTKYAPTFAPYVCSLVVPARPSNDGINPCQTPPPDDPSYQASTSRPTTQRAWFPSQHVISYQSGGVPTFNTSQAGGAGAAEEAEAESGISAWETRFGLRVDMLAAAAYVLSPLSGEFSRHVISVVREIPNVRNGQLYCFLYSKHTTITFAFTVCRHRSQSSMGRSLINGRK